MMRRLLAGLLLLLISLAIVAKVREAMRSRTAIPPASVADSGPPDLTLRPSHGRNPGGPAIDFSLGPAVPPDSATRAGARIRLGAEADRHYLDSLFNGTDSIVRHWPVGIEAIGVAIVPGGPSGFLPEMVSEVRQALDAWSPAAAGLRFLEQDDTTGAAMVVRWADSLESDRAGATDVTWDQAGRIIRVAVYLTTRSPSTGRPFAPETRRAIALHELGHALGLPHSTHLQDVMYPIATATALSDRDRFSLRLLYELPTGWIGTQSHEAPSQ
jgi:Matrixin